MKPTVVQGLTARPVPAGQELEAINTEIRPVLEAVRAAANYFSQFRASGDTTDSPGAYKTIWESPAVAEGASGMVDVQVIGVDTAGFTGAYRLYYGYIKWGGALGQFGNGTLYSFETAAAFNAQLTIVGDSVVLQVRDNGVAAKWEAVITVLEVTP